MNNLVAGLGFQPIVLVENLVILCKQFIDQIGINSSTLKVVKEKSARKRNAYFTKEKENGDLDRAALKRSAQFEARFRPVILNHLAQQSFLSIIRWTWKCDEQVSRNASTYTCNGRNLYVEEQNTSNAPPQFEEHGIVRRCSASGKDTGIPRITRCSLVTKMRLLLSTYLVLNPGRGPSTKRAGEWVY